MAGNSSLGDSGKYFEPLALAVATGEKIKDAAERLGCSESHAYHISGTDEFRKRVAAIRSEVTSQAVGKLAAAASQAVDTLIALMADTNPEPVRLNAAKAILASHGPLAELSELRSRLDALETQQGLRIAQ